MTMHQQQSSRADDRRASPRRQGRGLVRMHLEGQSWADSFVLRSRDRSDDSLFLESDLLFPVGERLNLELALGPAGQSVRRQGRVTRVTRGDNGADPGIVVGLLDGQSRA